MAFDAGAVVGEAILDTDQWEKGTERVEDSTAAMAGAVAAGMAAFEAIKAAIGFAVDSMVNAVKAANEYQKSFSNITAITNESTAGFQEMSRQLLSMDASLGSTKELSDAMYQAISAGAQAGAESMQLVTDAAKFARAGLTNTTVAVDVLTTAMNAYGSNVVSSTKASNLFFQATQYGKMTAEQLASSLGKSIPLYATLGVRLEELSAGMAAMTLSGISAEESTTQLNAIMNAFIKPSTEMIAKLKSLGYESGSAFIKANGLSGALKMLQEATGGNADALSKLIPNIEGVRGAMALSGTGGQNFAKILNEMNKGLNVTDEAFRRQINTFDRFNNAAATTQILFGNVGKYILDYLLVPVTDLTEKFNRWLLSLDGAISIQIVFEKIGYAFGVFYELINDFTQYLVPPFTRFFSEIKRIASNIFPDGPKNPITIFTALSQVMNTMGWILGNFVIAFSTFISSVMQGIQPLVNVVKLLGTFWDLMTGAGSLADVKTALKEIGGSYLDMWKNIGSGVIDAGKMIVANFKTLKAPVLEMGLEIKDTAEDFAYRAGAAVRKNIIPALVGVTKEYKQIEPAATSAGNAMIESSTSAGKAITIASKTISDKMKYATEEAAMAISDFIDGINNDLADLIGDATTAMLQKIGGVVAAVKPIAAELLADFRYVLTGIEAIINQVITNTTAAFQNMSNTELTRLDDMLAQKLITEEQYNARKDEIQTAAAKREDDIKRGAFEANKSFSIAKVWMDSASAIMGFWASSAVLGPVLGPIMAGVMTAAALGIASAQTSLISSQQYVPAMATGTDFAPGGMALVGEQGPELVNIPRGSQVIPAGITSKMIQGGTGMTINFNGAVVREKADFDRIVSAIESRLGRKVAYA